MNHSIPVLCSIALAIVFALFASKAHADDTRTVKSNIRLASLNAKPAPLNLCMGVSTSPDCEATFNHALESTDDDSTSVVVTATGTGDMKGPRGIQPLHFQKRALWARRLETVGKEGIAFFRVPRGQQKELVVGINRKGILGFQLRQTSN